MSWFSHAIKKITKIQPGKVIVNAVAGVAKSLPVIGGLVTTVENAAAKAESAIGKGSSTLGSLWSKVTGAVSNAADTVGNVNQAAKDTSKTSNYIIIGVIALVAIALIFVMRKR